MSRADLQLVAELVARGVTVSQYQLEHWRRLRLVPRNVRHGLGRGRGSVSVVPADAVDRAEMAARAGCNWSSPIDYTVRAMRGGFESSVPIVREPLLYSIKVSLRRGLPSGSGDDPEQVLDDVATDAEFFALPFNTRISRQRFYESELWSGSVVAQKRKAYELYLTARMAGLEHVPCKDFEECLLVLGRATPSNVTAALAFARDVFGPQDQSYELLAAMEVHDLVMALGRAALLLDIVRVGLWDNRWGTSFASRRQIARLKAEELDWLLHSCWSHRTGVLDVALHEVRTRGFREVVDFVLGGDAIQNLARRVDATTAGVTVHPLGCRERRRLMRNREVVHSTWRRGGRGVAG